MFGGWLIFRWKMKEVEVRERERPSTDIYIYIHISRHLPWVFDIYIHIIYG